MEFIADPSLTKHISLVVTAFQTTGTLLIALLLRLLTRGIPDQFLDYWSIGWVCLSAAMVSLTLSILVPPLLAEGSSTWVRRPALAAYAVLQYAFGFYLWAGCRAYARGTRLTRADWLLFAPPAAFGVVAPIFLSEIDVLFPFHAGVFGGFSLLALVTTLGCRPDARQALIGLRLTQAALGGITLLFWHYGVVMGWLLAHGSRGYPPYLQFAALYDGFVEMVLGFGMVVLGTDTVRRELAERNRELAEANRRLAEATEQLTEAARTDSLTGLLNRRALDAILAERADTAFSGSVAVLDVNDLKLLNDTVGHAAGDAAIQLTARALRGQFRITDPIFRVGGDEFLVILEGGRAADLSRRLVALDAALKRQRLPGVPQPRDVVVAWGMADFESHAGFADALHQADAAMYACKNRRKSGGV